MRNLLLLLTFLLLCRSFASAQAGKYKEQLKGTWQLVEVEQTSKKGGRSIQDPAAFKLQLKNGSRLQGTVSSPEMPGWYWGKYKFRKDGTVKKVKAISDYPNYIRDIQKKWDVDLYLVRLSAAKSYELTDDGQLVLYFEGGRFKVGKGRLLFRKAD